MNALIKQRFQNENTKNDENTRVSKTYVMGVYFTWNLLVLLWFVFTNVGKVPLLSANPPKPF
jgi:hypothetical protein